MTIHPPSYRLDAMLFGAPDAETSHHVAECAECTEYLAKLEREMRANTTGDEAERARDADAFMQKLAARATTESPEGDVKVVRLQPRPRVRRALPYASVVVALAAAIFLYVRGTPRVAPNASEESESPTAVRFKGGMQLAVVRDRNGVQERFTDVTLIQPGDRLRAEIATDHEGPLEIGILQTDGAYLPLLTPTALPLGTHFSDRAAKVDEHASPGWVIAGHPDEVKRARESKDLSRVRVIPIQVQ